jgi:hypothetical protein
MKNQEATSPPVSEAPEKTTDKPDLEIAATSGDELSLLKKEIEALKELIQEDRKKSSQGWSSNPAFLVVLAFLLTGLLGNLLTAYLTYRQHERAAERSFIDESNKLRIQKIGDVWEQLDQDEHTIDQLMDGDENYVAKFPTPNDRAKEIKRIVQTDQAKVSQYRFWLGQLISDRVNNYLNANIAYSIGKLSGTPEADLEDAKNARDAAKSTVDQIREELLRGVPK